MDLSSRIKRNDNVAYRVIDEEALLVNPKDNTLYTLNNVAARIWELLDGQKTCQEIAKIIKEEFEADMTTIQSDALSLMQDLLHKNLTVLA